MPRPSNQGLSTLFEDPAHGALLRELAGLNEGILIAACSSDSPR